MEFLDHISDSRTLSIKSKVEEERETSTAVLEMIRNIQDRTSSRGSSFSSTKSLGSHSSRSASIVMDHRNSLDVGLAELVTNSTRDEKGMFASSDNLVYRVSISSNDEIRQITTRFWQVCSRTMEAREEVIAKSSFMEIMLAIEKATQNEFDEIQALEKVEARWMRDTNNLHSMGYEEFHDSLFSLVDEATQDVSLYSYNQFLWDLFAAITISQVTYADGRVQDITLRHSDSCLSDIISCIPLSAIQQFHYIVQIAPMDPNLQTIGQLALTSDTRLQKHLVDFQKKGEDLLHQHLMSKTSTEIIQEAKQWIQALSRNSKEKELAHYFIENPIVLKKLEHVKYEKDLLQSTDTKRKAIDQVYRQLYEYASKTTEKTLTAQITKCFELQENEAINFGKFQTMCLLAYSSNGQHISKAIIKQAFNHLAQASDASTITSSTLNHYLEAFRTEAEKSLLSIPLTSEKQSLETNESKSKSSLRLFLPSVTDTPKKAQREYGTRRRKSKDASAHSPVSIQASSPTSAKSPKTAKPHVCPSPRIKSVTTSPAELPDISEAEVLPGEEVSNMPMKQYTLVLPSLPKFHKKKSSTTILLSGVQSKKLAQLARFFRSSGLQNTAIILNEADVLSKMQKEPNKYDLLIVYYTIFICNTTLFFQG